MKFCKKCSQTKSKLEFRKRRAAPDGLRGECKTCEAKYQGEYYSENKEKVSLRQAKHRSENKEKLSLRGVKYRSENKEKVSLRQAKYYSENKEKLSLQKAKYNILNKENNKEYQAKYNILNKEKVSLRQAKHRSENKGRSCWHAAQRRASKLQSSPIWADKEQIRLIYAYRAFIEKSTGIKHHVDHIVPLKNDHVCGLHNEFNLRVVPAEENLSKSNKFVDEPDFIHPDINNFSLMTAKTKFEVSVYQINRKMELV